MIFWLTLWALSLGTLSVDATYTDGLHIRLNPLWGHKKK